MQETTGSRERHIIRNKESGEDLMMGVLLILKLYVEQNYSFIPGI